MKSGWASPTDSAPAEKIHVLHVDAQSCRTGPVHVGASCRTPVGAGSRTQAAANTRRHRSMSSPPSSARSACARTRTAARYTPPRTGSQRTPGDRVWMEHESSTGGAPEFRPKCVLPEMGSDLVDAPETEAERHDWPGFRRVEAQGAVLSRANGTLIARGACAAASGLHRSPVCARAGTLRMSEAVMGCLHRPSSRPERLPLSWSSSSRPSRESDRERATALRSLLPPLSP